MNKELVRKKFIKRLIIGSIAFGILAFGSSIYINGVWNFSGILWCLYGAVTYGVLFYLISRFIIYKKLWEKDGNNDVEEDE